MFYFSRIILGFWISVDSFTARGRGVAAGKFFSWVLILASSSEALMYQASWLSAVQVLIIVLPLAARQFNR